MTSRMTATDELRALLDGRGAEYTFIPGDEYSREHIKIGSTEIWTNGRDEVAVYFITPEQAVDAALGRGTCRECAGMEDVFECSECGMRYEGWALKRWARYCPNCGRRRVG